MKISYISKSNTWNDQQIVAEAKKQNIKFEKRDIMDLNNPSIYKSLGDVILWRSSSLEPRSGRITLLNNLLKRGKFVVNRSIVDYPAVIFKQFQQEYVRESTRSIETISTFTFNSSVNLRKGIKSNLLKFPFIKKPNLGAKGEGIKLIANEQDLNNLKDEEIKISVFQNFIENDGDYRVLVIGGRPIGAIKRIGKEGSFINNVSMGGTAVEVVDGKLKTELFKIATQVVAIFNLGFCGVDVIQDENTGELYFLELNTVPQWEGFQGCTEINVAGELLKYCQEIGGRKIKSTVELVEDCYIEHSDKLANRRFHFFTRMFLWTGEQKYLDSLNKLKANYYGKSKEELGGIIQKILNEKDIYQKRICNKKKFRIVSADKYPLLGAYSEILFRNLMSKNIFGEDLKGVIQEFISDKELLQIRDDLLNNESDLISLATFAINYLYFIEDYFEGDKDKVVNVGQLLKIIEKNSLFSQKKNPKIIINDIYFMTHIIIGATKFYKKSVKKEDEKKYLQIVKLLEKIIDKHYFRLSLDTKLELLVCAKLFKYKSILEPQIRQEAEMSLSPIGNFLVDTLNAKKDFAPKSWLGSEHRNVLYIMINRDWVGKT